MKKCETCKYLKIVYDYTDPDITLAYCECTLSKEKHKLNLQSLRYPEVIFQMHGLGPRNFGCIYHENKIWKVYYPNL